MSWDPEVQDLAVEYLQNMFSWSARADSELVRLIEQITGQKEGHLSERGLRFRVRTLLAAKPDAPSFVPEELAHGVDALESEARLTFSAVAWQRAHRDQMISGSFKYEQPQANRLEFLRVLCVEVGRRASNTLSLLSQASEHSPSALLEYPPTDRDVRLDGLEVPNQHFDHWFADLSHTRRKQALHFYATLADIENQSDVGTSPVPNVSIYVDGDPVEATKHGENIAKALGALYAAYGLEFELSDGPVIASWWGTFKVWAKNPLTWKEAGQRAKKVEQSLEQAYLRWPMAEEGLVQAQAAATVIAAIGNAPRAVVFTGVQLIVKSEAGLFVHALSPEQRASFEQNSHLLQDPDAAIEHLENLNLMAERAERVRHVDPRQIEAGSAALGAQGSQGPQGSQGLGL